MGYADDYETEIDHEKGEVTVTVDDTTDYRGGTRTMYLYHDMPKNDDKPTLVAKEDLVNTWEEGTLEDTEGRTSLPDGEEVTVDFDTSEFEEKPGYYRVYLGSKVEPVAETRADTYDDPTERAVHGTEKMVPEMDKKMSRLRSDLQHERQVRAEVESEVEELDSKLRGIEDELAEVKMDLKNDGGRTEDDPSMGRVRALISTFLRRR